MYWYSKLRREAERQYQKWQQYVWSELVQVLDDMRWSKWKEEHEKKSLFLCRIVGSEFKTRKKNQEQVKKEICCLVWKSDFAAQFCRYWRNHFGCVERMRESTIIMVLKDINISLTCESMQMLSLKCSICTSVYCKFSESTTLSKNAKYTKPETVPEILNCSLILLGIQSFKNRCECTI